MTSILVAPYPFKGTYSSPEAATAIASGLDDLEGGFSTLILPLGDGGAGTLDALVRESDACYLGSEVVTLNGERRVVDWGRRSDGAAVIEAARVIGLAALPHESRAPLSLTTSGIGSLVVEACEHGTERILIGLGDTATHDCGIGMASTLGYRFLDRNGTELEPVGGSLERLAAIDRAAVPEQITKFDVTALCDVLNPLVGPDGAARRFLAQKGGSPEEIERMEVAAITFVDIVRRDLGVELDGVSGAGAAGGLGAGIRAFLGGRLVGGAEFVLDAIGIDAIIEKADLVITGEGRVDRGTLLGKGAAMVVGRARRGGKSALVIAGSVEGERRAMEERLGAPILALSEAGAHATIESLGERLREEVKRLTAR